MDLNSPFPALRTIADLTHELFHIPLITRVVDVRNPYLLTGVGGHDDLNRLLDIPAWRHLKPLAECCPRLGHVNPLGECAGKDAGYQLPDGKTSIAFPVIPQDTVRPSGVCLWTNMVVGKKVKIYLILISKRSTSLDDIQKSDRISNVDQLAFVNAKDFEISQSRNEETQDVHCEEWDSVHMHRIQKVSKIDRRPNCLYMISIIPALNSAC